MYKFEKSVFIKRSPKDVFDFLNTPSNTVQWQSGSQYAEWTSNDSVGVGSTFKAGTKLLGRIIEAELELTEWDPPNRSSIKVVNGPIPFESYNRFEAQGDGTLLTSTFQIELGNFFKLAEGLVGKQIEKNVESDYSALKILLDNGAG